MSQIDIVVDTSTDEESPVMDNSSTGVMDAPTVQEDVLKGEDELENSDYAEGPLCNGGTSNEKTDDAEGSDQIGPTIRPEREFEKPSKSLQKKIRKLIEFYFSDKYLQKHSFLVDRILHYDGGYVSLKFLTKFHQVKAHTKDYRVVAYSLRDSEILEVNEESTLVRRHVSLPNHLHTARSCRVVAFNLPFEKNTVPSVAELFQPFGEITLIQLLRPEKTIPPGLGNAITDHIKQLNEVCVLVEFDKHEAAKVAVTKLKSMDICQKGMHVARVSDWFYREKSNDQKSVPEVDIDDKQAGEERSGTNEPNIKNLHTNGFHKEEHASTETDGESPNSLSKTVDEEINEDASRNVDKEH